jgi:hypothetical protein
MPKLIAILISYLVLAMPALSQETPVDPDAAAASAQEAADEAADDATDEAADDAADEAVDRDLVTDAEDAAGDDEESGDDSDLDLQTYEENDDVFVPTEEIPPDQPIPFPSDI